MYKFPSLVAGSRADLYHGGGQTDSPRAAGGAHHRHRVGGKKRGSPRVGGAPGTAFESVGAKQAAPEQGSSDRLAKRTRVRSKM
jgi:hypothetical protein